MNFKHLVLGVSLALLSANTLAAPISYKIDPSHTDVIASWNHFGFSNPSAHFGKVDGTIVYDAQNPTASSVSVTIPLSGINSHVEAFDKHLKSADLFDMQKHALATFKSTKVEVTGKGKMKVHGLLTIRGITKPVVLDTRLNGQGIHPMKKTQAIGFDATTTIKRSDFGISYALPAVGDIVDIRITTEALVPDNKTIAKNKKN